MSNLTARRRSQERRPKRRPNISLQQLRHLPYEVTHGGKVIGYLAFERGTHRPRWYERRERMALVHDMHEKQLTFRVVSGPIRFRPVTAAHLLLVTLDAVASVSLDLGALVLRHAEGALGVTLDAGGVA